VKISYLTHSLQSCWNHGNAHFLRGVLRELIARGHAATAWEPRDAWSRLNLVRDAGDGGLEPYRRAYPELTSRRYDRLDLGEALDGAELVIVHEWNDPEVVAAVGRARARGGRFILLFHDTHHRAVSDPDGIAAFDLSGYDGVLAFGETLAEVYRRRGWGSRVFVWHEAADIRLFHPPAVEGSREGLIWIGNWGDGERSRELEAFLLEPAQAAGLALDIHGVRYPPQALETLARHGAHYHGWLANASAPAAFARRIATIHVPRRFYVEQLPGIPTIRVFEALACGIPLVSAPWTDSEGLFRAGRDFLMVRNGAAMTAALRSLKNDPDLRQALAAAGLETILARHTCAHRVEALLGISGHLKGAAASSSPESVT
jgi:spore maturation protein CgeB